MKRICLDTAEYEDDIQDRELARIMQGTPLPPSEQVVTFIFTNSGNIVKPVAR